MSLENVPLEYLRPRLETPRRDISNSKRIFVMSRTRKKRSDLYKAIFLQVQGLALVEVLLLGGVTSRSQYIRSLALSNHVNNAFYDSRHWIVLPRHTKVPACTSFARALDKLIGYHHAQRFEEYFMFSYEEMHTL